MAKDWIANAVGRNPGGLHRSLGVPEDQKIPEAKLAQGARSKNPTIRRQVNLARTLRRLPGR